MESKSTFQIKGKVSFPVDIISWSTKKIHSSNHWLNARSEFYSRIAETPISRRLVILVHLITICIIISASAIEQHPFVAVASALCAAWLVYRLSKADKSEE